jgi:hypothetical protein
VPGVSAETTISMTTRPDKGDPPMKKLLLLLVVIAIGAVVAKKVRDA